MTRVLPPTPDPPDEIRVSRVTLTIGGRRYEFTHRIESREITRGPADVIAMPDNRKAIARMGWPPPIQPIADDVGHPARNTAHTAAPRSAKPSSAGSTASQRRARSPSNRDRVLSNRK
jgi:hypothetical protein